MPLATLTTTEATTAATDLLLALVSFLAAGTALRGGAEDAGRRWGWAFLWGGVAATAGAAAHALGLAAYPDRALTVTVTLGLGLSAAYVLLALAETAGGSRVATRWEVGAVLAGVLAGLSPLISGGRLDWLMGYMLAAYSAALGLHAGRGVVGRPGGRWISVGMAVLLAAVAVQREWVAVPAPPALDPNGVSHLLMAAGIALTARGVLKNRAGTPQLDE